MNFLEQAAEENQEEVSEDSLKRISRLAKELQTKQLEFDLLKHNLEEKKKEITKLEQGSIPEAMLEVGMSSFALDTGETVSFKEEVSASVSDYESFYEFLEERGDDGLMKITLEIGKVPKNILAMLTKRINEEFGILASSKLYIHPMTLKKYIKELCGVGGDTIADYSLAELDEKMVKTFTYYKTKVK